MTVEERLARLERQNWWMRRIGALGLAVVAVLVLMGQGKDDVPVAVLRAREIRVVDDVGQTRVLLTTNAATVAAVEKEPSPQVRVYCTKASGIIDAVSKGSSVGVAAWPERAAVRVSAGEECARMSAGRHLTSVSVRSEQGSACMNVNVGPSLSLNEPTGKVVDGIKEERTRLILNVVPGVHTSVAMYGHDDVSPSEDATRFSLDLWDGGRLWCGLSIRDAEGNVIWHAPSK